MNLIATLFPEDPTRLREIDHLHSLVRQTRTQNLDDQIAFWIASAHPRALDQAARLFADMGYANHRLLLTDFVFQPAMDERRAHEISHAKQFLARAWETKSWDWICFYDADVE